MRELDRIAELYPALMRSMSRLRDVLPGEGDLTYNQYKTLLTVSDLGPCSLGDLTRHLRVAASSASEMVERLTKAGLVQRETARGDRRAVAIRLSRAGERLLGRIRQGIVKNYGKILGRLSPGDRARLARALEDLVETISSVEGQATGKSRTPRGSTT
ncbi:MAG TPA: MarR family transcriptional regulator [Anaeromyxobacteraceae bacterium]|nr:MarR family transcriptional regulator [Anaeromyxobacteraceae bacterium]